MVVFAGVLASPLDAAVCGRANQPGATLLYPYFEVDLADPTGRTTLISINNADQEPALAHVVLWTNWGIPTLAFDVFLDPEDSQTVNMRQVLEGKFPVTSPPPVGDGNFGGCAHPLAAPEFSEQEMFRLWARHTGQAVDWDQCHSAVQEESLAVGYITVDVINDCSDTIRLHADGGYFIDGGLGFASNRNVLWGDLYLIDPGDAYAQGVEAVSLIADAERFGVGNPEPTFYQEEILKKDDNRTPLSHTYRGRFLNGGGFDGGTELILWHAGFCVPLASANCDGASPLPPTLTQEAVVAFRDEHGRPAGEPLRRDLTRRVTRLKIGSEEWPVDAISGHFEIRVDGVYSGEAPRPSAQAWVIPVLSSSNRYSIGLNAVQVDGACE